MASKYPTIKLDNTMFKCSYNNGKRGFVTNSPYELEKIMTKLGPFENAMIAACIDSHFPPDGPRIPDICAEWSACKIQLRSISLSRTKETRLQDTKRAAELKMRIAQALATVVNGTAPAGVDNRIGDMRKELKDLAPSERTLNQTLENIAYSKGQLHDTGSAAMYRRLHARSSDQWINGVMKANWEDPSSPTEIEDEAVTGADKIADGFVHYYESLFARKHPDPAAHGKCMEVLRDPNRPQVQPPNGRSLRRAHLSRGGPAPLRISPHREVARPGLAPKRLV